MDQSRSPYDFSKVEQKLSDANVIPVGPGMRYTTIAAAVAACTSPAYDNQWSIIAAPGTSRDYTPVDWVHVIFEEDVAAAVEARSVAPVCVRAPAAVVWRIDDGNNYGSPANGTISQGWWFTANAGLADPLDGNANAKPYEYLLRRGIVMSLAVVSSLVNAENYFSAAQLRLLATLGWEICSHSVTHGASPTTFAEELSEIVGSKVALESFLNSGAVADGANTGCYVDTFINPGTWTTGTYRDREFTDMESSHGRLIKRHYKYSQSDYLRGSLAFNGLPAYGDLPGGQLDATSNADSGAAYIADFIARANAPGGISTIYHHQVVDSGATGVQINVATFKALADAIFAAMQARTLMPVSISTAKNCILEHPGTAEYWMGGVQYGLVSAGIDSAGSGTVDWTQGAGYALTVEEDASDANTLHTYTQDKHIKLVEDDATEAFTVVKWWLRPNTLRRYQLRIDLKQLDTDLAADAQVRIGYGRTADATEVTALQALHVRKTTSAWVTHYATFYVPDWARNTYVQIKCNAFAANKGFKASNVQICEI